MIPYARQTIEDDDVEAVVAALRSDWLTQGPRVAELEKQLAEYCGAKYAVVMSNGTAALHAMYHAAGIGPGDEIITSAMTFAATANAALWMGARVVFADIDEATGNIDPQQVVEKITPATKAIVAIDYTGRPADLERLRAIARERGVLLLEDGCHALGATLSGRKIGTWSDATAFSFHPAKHITTGEGGAVLTDNEAWYLAMKRFVVHGISKDRLVRPSPGAWYHEMQVLGLNYRLTDIQCALGMTQLKKLDRFLEARRERVAKYHEELAGIPGLVLPPPDDDVSRSAWHLFMIRLLGPLAGTRSAVFAQLQQKGIGVQVHYIPVYRHPYYEGLGYPAGLCPRAEAWYESIISLPLYPTLTSEEQSYVIKIVKEAVEKHSTL